MKLSPSNKIKRRYLLIGSGDKSKIEKVILDYVGILGWAKAQVVFVETKTPKGIVLSVDRKEADNIKAALELGKVKVLRISGTIEGLDI